MNQKIAITCTLAAALAVSASNSLSAATQDATPISRIAPAYSHDLRASGVEGEVVVSFTITAKGQVRNPTIVSSTNRLLERPTLAAIHAWKFTPATRDGVAISQRAVQTVAFAIPELHSDSVRAITSVSAAPSKSTSAD